LLQVSLVKFDRRQRSKNITHIMIWHIKNNNYCEGRLSIRKIAIYLSQIYAKWLIKKPTRKSTCIWIFLGEVSTSTVEHSRNGRGSNRTRKLKKKSSYKHVPHSEKPPQVGCCLEYFFCLLGIIQIICDTFRTPHFV